MVVEDLNKVVGLKDKQIMSMEKKDLSNEQEIKRLKTQIAVKSNVDIKHTFNQKYLDDSIT